MPVILAMGSAQPLDVSWRSSMNSDSKFENAKDNSLNRGAVFDGCHFGSE